MDQIKIWFTDFWPEWNNEDFITPVLKKHFEVVLDKNNPDVLFHSIFNRASDALNYKCKKILFLGENHRPSEYITNYSISFDPHNETNFRLPLWQVYLLMWPGLKNRLYDRFKVKEFEKWCAFIVSNPSNFFRNSLFYQLHNYKSVNSYGRYLTNDLSLQELSKGQYWRDVKDFYFQTHHHKFMLAIENSPYKYYCTEKLMDAFLGNTLPIYWGDTRVAEDWNEKAFINGTRIDILETVKKIDKDNGLFNAMYSEPVFTDEQKKKLENNLNNFETWLIEIIKK
jgi:hypothetical protein